MNWHFVVDLLLKALMNYGAVILGWALGFMSALLSDKLKARSRRKAVTGAISTELREIAFRLVSVAWLIQRRRGAFDRELIRWVLQHAEQYGGPNPKGGVVEGMQGLLSRTDAELAALAAHERATAAPGLFQPGIEALYSATAMSGADDLDPSYSLMVLDILSHIRMFNDVRENGLFYQRLTFDSRLGGDNHKKVVQNADLTEDQLAKRARIIVDKIIALEELYPLGKL